MVQEAKKQADLPSETTLAALVSAKFNPELINHLSIFLFSCVQTINLFNRLSQFKNYILTFKKLNLYPLFGERNQG
jgi:hypothetical protein